MKTKLIILFAFLVLGAQYAHAFATRLLYPASNSIQKDSVEINYSVPSGSIVYITFTMTGGYYYSTLGHSYPMQVVGTSGPKTFYFNPANLSASSSLITPSGSFTSIPDGIYSVQGTYFYSGNTYSLGPPSILSNVKVDTKTLPPALIQPTNGARAINSFILQDSVPEIYKNNTKKITLTDSSNSNVYVLTLNNALKDSFALYMANTVSASGIQSMTNGPSIPGGTYMITFSYQDSLGHTAASTASRTIYIGGSTQTPSIISPMTSSIIGSQMNFQFTIPEKYLPGSVNLAFNSSGSSDTLFLSNAIAVGTDTLMLDAKNLASSSYVLNATGSILNDGIYTISVLYQDSAGDPAASASVSNVTLDGTTQTPILTSPANGYITSQQIAVNFTLPETPFANSVYLTISSDSVSDTLLLQNVAAGVDSFTLNVKDLLASAYVQTATFDTLNSGIYAVTLSYQDSLGNPAAFMTDSNVVLDEETLAPSFILPAASFTGNLIPIQYLLPETADSGSVKMIFVGAAITDTINLIDISPRSTAYLDPHHFIATTPFVSATLDTLPDGIYNVQLSYQDYLGNAAAVVIHDSITIDTHTQTPSFILPQTGAVISTLMNVSFAIPERASNDTVNLAWMGADTIYTTLQTSGSGVQNYALHTDSLALTPCLINASQSYIPDGTYNLAISYTDTLLNPAAGSSISNITIDKTTLSPTLISPASSSTVTTHIAVSFILPENALDSTAHLVFSGFNFVAIDLRTRGTGLQTYILNATDLSSSPGVISATQDTIADGTYTNVFVSYQDTLSNPNASATDSSVTVDKITQTPVLTSPAGSSTVERNIAVNFTLPETPSRVQLIFSTTGFSDTLVLANATEGSNNFTLSSKNLLNASYVQSATSDTLTDGVYSITLTYIDTSGNAAASTSVSNVTLDDITETPVITKPANSSALPNLMTFHFTIPESYLPNSLKLIFDSAGTTNTVLLSNTLRVGADTLVLNASNLASSSLVQSATKNSLSDGIYNITLSYQDIHGNPAATVTAANVTVDKETLTPILTSPASSSTVSQFISFNYTLPEKPMSGSLQLTFTTSGINTQIELADVSAGTHSLTLNIKNPVASSGVFAVIGDSLKAGIYSVTLSYMDTLGNPVASVTDTNITIELTTQAPVLLSPVNDLLIGGGNPIPLSFTLPEMPQVNSVKVKFDNGVNPPCTVILNTDSSGTSSINLNPQNLFSTSGLVFTTYDSLFDGTYTVTVTYQDSLGNPAITSNTGTMILDETTQTPVIMQPTSSSIVSSPITIQFFIPEKYLAGSLKLVFDSAGTKNTVVLKNTVPVGLDTLMLDSRNLSTSSIVQSATRNSLSDGIYNITLSYQDSLGNPVASTMVTNITLDTRTLAPVLIFPTAGGVVTSNPLFDLQYMIPETPKAGSVQVVFSNAGFSCTATLDITTAGTKSDTINLKVLNSSSSIIISSTYNSLPDGTYHVVIMYQDALGNPVAVSDTGVLVIDETTLAPALILPGDTSINTSMVNVSFIIPENALNNTVNVSLYGPHSVNMLLHTIGSGLQSYTFNTNNFALTPGLISVSQSTLPDGIYSLRLGYQDTLANAPAFSIQTAVSISGVTPPPVVTTKSILPDCSFTADLDSAITSDTTGLTIVYYSDSTFTTPVGKREAPGTYYVKVTNAYELTDSTSLAVDAEPARPQAPVAQDEAICSGSTASLSAAASGTPYWYTAPTAGTLLGHGADFITDTLTTDATFYVADSTCLMSATRTRVAVTVHALPAVQAVASLGGNSVCAGSSSALMGVGASRYTWSGGIQNDVPFVPVATETYTVTGTDGNNCTNTDTFTLTYHPLPTVVANTTDTAVCAGTSVTLSGTGASSYIWTDNVSNSVSFVPVSSNTYTVTGTDSNFCRNTASVSVTVNPLPVSTTTVSGSDITANQAGATYQWLDCDNNNQPIAGERNQTYRTIGEGSFAVFISLNGCTATSSCVNIITTGISETAGSSLVNIYPNPSNGAFTIHATAEGTYTIVDETGQTIEVVKLSAENNYTVNAATLNSGIYFIVGFNKGELTRQKLVVVK